MLTFMPKNSSAWNGAKAPSPYVLDRVPVPRRRAPAAQSTSPSSKAVVGRLLVVVRPELDAVEARRRGRGGRATRSPSSAEVTVHAPLRSRSAEVARRWCSASTTESTGLDSTREDRERGGELDPDGAGVRGGEAAHVLGLAVGEGPEALDRLERQGGQRGVTRRP